MSGSRSAWMISEVWAKNATAGGIIECNAGCFPWLWPLGSFQLPAINRAALKSHSKPELTIFDDIKSIVILTHVTINIGRKYAPVYGGKEFCHVSENSIRLRQDGCSAIC